MYFRIFWNQNGESFDEIFIQAEKKEQESLLSFRNSESNCTTRQIYK